MAAKVGDVVFKAGDVVNMEEFWDDSALIKAYDKAVNSFKFGLGDESEKISQYENHKSKKKKSRRNRHKKRESKRSFDEIGDKTRKWSVGDKCYALYSEDGLMYDAEIIEICSDVSDVCVVKYSNYGNKERQYLTHLIPLTQEGNNVAYRNPNGEYSDTCSSNAGDTSHLKWKASCKRDHGKLFNNFSVQISFLCVCDRHKVNVQDLKRSCDLNQNHSTHHPHYNTNFIPPLPPFLAHDGYVGIPRPPVPPPPPPVSLDDLQGDDESLASMLMSWYLSGYHTGYFQAMQQFRRNCSPSYPSVSTSQPTCPSNNSPQSPGINMDTKE